MFIIIHNKEESENIFNLLNCIHLSLTFTFEKKNNRLPFLNVKMKQTLTGFKISGYRKPTFNGQYLCCKRQANSFFQKKNTV